jgi:uncharacterized protein (TIGR00297 family)
LRFLFQNENLLLNFLTGIILASIISFFSYRYKFLSKGGTAALFFLAILIYGFGGWKFTLPVLVFFLFSSLITKVRKKRNPLIETYFEKTGERDHFQVFANGGFALVIVVLNYFYSSELFYIVYVSSIASVCADTWATETGTLSENKTVNILTLKRIEQGMSGGISLAGTVGSYFGALVIAATSLLWIESDYLLVLIVISFAGLFGSFIDSILGASVQVQYLCSVCNKVTEKRKHCSHTEDIKKGVLWINNDVVNAGSSVAGGIFSILLVDVFRI